MANFANLLSDLKRQDPAHPLVFKTQDGEVGAGYHVTELRHSMSTGIDCGGNIDAWQEARLQILDGHGSTHMTVGKFGKILEQSISALPELAKAPLMVEFGHDNKRLTLMSLDGPEHEEGNVVLQLDDARAVCKPAQRTKDVAGEDVSCCSSVSTSKSDTSCCQPAKTPVGAGACCG